MNRIFTITIILVVSGLLIPISIPQAHAGEGDFIVVDSVGVLLRMTPNGATSIIDVINPNLGTPRYVTIDSAGDFIVTSSSNLFRITTDGELSIIANISSQGIAIDADGNYITVKGNSLVKITPAGEVSNIVTGGLGNPKDVVVDSFGDFILTGTNGNLRKVTPMGEVSTIAGFDDGLIRLFGVEIDSDGDFIVINTTGELQKVTPSGTVTTIANIDISSGATIDVAIDSNGDFIVPQIGGKIIKVTPTGEISTIIQSGFDSIWSIAIEPKNQIVTEEGDFIVVDNSGNLLHVKQSGAVETIAKNLANPFDVAIDSAGDFIVTGNLGELLKVTADGDVSTIANNGLGFPSGVVIDSDGDFILASSGSVLRVTPNGIVSTIASSGLGTLNDIVIDSSGDFIVTDLSGKLLRITPDGDVSTIAINLGNPAGVAIDSNGDFIVIDANGRLLKVSPDGTVTTIKNPFGNVFGIAIDSNGDYIITSLHGFLFRVPPNAPSSGIAINLEDPLSVAIVPPKQSIKDVGGSSAKSYLNKPTFGLSHATHQILVENGFTVNGNSFSITDNWHTDFEKQTIHVGESNTFSAKSYAPFGLHRMEFMFGIPEVGKAHESEAVVEVWLNRNGAIENIVLNQKDHLIDSESLSAQAEMTECTKNSIEKNCNLVSIFVSFNEAPLEEVFALQGVDFTRRNHITYLNEGLLVQGESLNLSKTDLFASGDKGVGLVELTLIDKRNNIWVDDSGNKYNKNSFGTFFKTTTNHLERDDPLVKVLTRQNSNFSKIISYEQSRAIHVFNGTTIQSEIPDSFAYVFPKTNERISDEMKSQMIEQEKIAKQLLKESTLQARW